MLVVYGGLFLSAPLKPTSAILRTTANKRTITADKSTIKLSSKFHDNAI